MRSRCKQCGSRAITHAQSCPKYEPPPAWENPRNIAAYNVFCRRPECVALFPHHGKELWKGQEPIINTLRAEEP